MAFAGKHRIRKFFWTVLGIGLVLALAFGCTYLFMYVKTPRRRSADDGTSISAAIYNPLRFNNLLKSNAPLLYDSLSENGWSSVAIPGLRATNTLNSGAIANATKATAENAEELAAQVAAATSQSAAGQSSAEQSAGNGGTIARNATADDGKSSGKSTSTDTSSINPVLTCEDMVPQGITVSDSYLFVSAYCAEKEHDSVIYMLNKATGSYIKTIALAGTPHVGGIAYARESDGIWVTTNQSNKVFTAQISLIKMDDIMAYDLVAQRAPIGYRVQYDLEGLSFASSVSYYGGYLVVGRFCESGGTTVVCYELGSGGVPHLVYKAGDYLQAITSVRAYKSFEWVQNVCADNGYVYVSQSYGPFDSALLIMDSQSQLGVPGWSDLVEENVVTSLDCPAYLEQAVVDGDSIYLVFEGASSKYRNRDVSMHTDRIIKLSKSKLFATLDSE